MPFLNVELLIFSSSLFLLILLGSMPRDSLNALLLWCPPVLFSFFVLFFLLKKQERSCPSLYSVGTFKF